jgi:hypothetical protein
MLLLQVMARSILKGDFMKRAITLAIAFSVIPTACFAFRLDGRGCTGNGEECRVYCDNGDLAGSMFFNGSVWTDGVKWDRDRDTEAAMICAANGAACQ